MTPDARQTKLNELYEQGKAKGTMTYKDIMNQLMEFEIEPDQFDKVLETFEALGVEVVNERDPPEAEQIQEPLEMVLRRKTAILW